MTSPVPISVPFTERDFRDAMGSFATGVCVVTALNEDGKAIGMTVNSFSSVSLTPPLVLVCLGNGSPRSKAIIDAKRFNISMLSDAQQSISAHFAQPGDGISGDGMTAQGTNGVPVIAGATAQIECDLEAQYPGGDHVIVVGRVSSLQANPKVSPLLYFQGGYRQLSDEA